MHLKSNRFFMLMGTAITAVACAFTLHNLLVKPVMVVHAATAASSACTFPTAVSGNDRTAWQIFVAANCPTGNASAPLTWETWPTQEQVFAASSTATVESLKSMGAGVNTSLERFHPSVLAQTLHSVESAQPLAIAPNQCNTQKTSAVNPYTGASRTRILCEEVRMNPAAAQYVIANKLNTLQGQGTFIQNGGKIDFPTSAIELKADWEQNCTDNTLHSETIQGVNYCLVAMHINSKVVPDWLWATFETLSAQENPARCYSIGCTDLFGFAPAVVPSGYNSLKVRSAQKMTAQLTTLETSAGLESDLAQYTLDGAQTSFLRPNGSPTLLGNSVTEAELAGVPLNAASCITCHSTSNVNTQGQQNLGPLSMNMVGKPPAIPGYAPRDFSWTFIIAPQQ
ncbi:MAG: hypothetical protein ACRD3S_14320 [Terracidiphilus sp.]